MLSYLTDNSLEIAALIASELRADQVDGLSRLLTGPVPVVGFFSLVATGLIGALSKSMDSPDTTASELIDALNRAIVRLDNTPVPAPDAPVERKLN